MVMEYKKREETKYIYIVLQELPQDFTKDSLFVSARRAGELDTGYHIILHNTGDIEYDRPLDSVAQYDFPDYSTSLYVLAEMVKKGKLTDAQQIVLDRQIKTLYPKAKVKEVK